MLGPACLAAGHSEHDWCTIFVPSHVFELDPDFKGEPVPVDTGICRVTRPDHQLASQFRGAVRGVLATSSRYRALTKAEPDETSVADVMLQHGEWEFGYVASRYRRLFGERPSETLRRKGSRMFSS